MGFKALIVDDEALVRNVLLNHLPWSSLGAESVFEAEDGYQALSLARENQVNLIISDIKMPRMNGLDFARRVREILPECAFIFLTAYADKDFMKEAIRIKVDRFVEKPIDPEEITQAIREILAEGIPDVRESFFGTEINQKIYRLSQEELVDFARAVRQKNREAGIKLIQNITEEMAVSTATEPDYVRHVFSQLLSTILESARDHGLMEEYRKAEVLCCSLSRYQSLEEIKNDVLRVMRYYFNAPEIHESDPVQLMNTYIEEHAEDASFSVAQMADDLFFTATYLSSIYKKKTGKSINEKMTEIRISRAKELLSSTDYRLYEIGQKIGYRDGKYFTRVFTKHVGVSPKQYREMQNNHE